jgi:hypothetical protein
MFKLAISKVFLVPYRGKTNLRTRLGAALS